MNYNITRLKPFGVMINPQNPGQDIREIEIERVREYFWQEHLVLVRGFRPIETALEFSDYCESYGTISLWPFGKILELTEHPHPEDHIFDNNYVPMHWDGMYRPQVPEFQIFQCVQAPLLGKGGRTTFSNTHLALKNASARDLTQWEKVTGTYQRKMEFYDSKVIAPVISTHPNSGIPVIRYNEPPRKELRPFLNPPTLAFAGLNPEEIQEFHLSLGKALYSPLNFYAHEWQTGDLVLADNHTLLHGRESFETKSPRHLRRVHVLGSHPLNNPHLVYHT